MNSIKIKTNAKECKEAIKEACIKALYEATGEIHTAVVRNTREDTGQLKNSWNHVVDESGLKATIGSPLENAIFEEFGTGEFAAEGNGRKGGWLYEDRHGKTHFTRGKSPSRAFRRAYNAKKHVINKALEHNLKNL